MGKHVELLAYTPDPVVVAQTAAGMCRATGPTKRGLEVAIESGHESVLEHVCSGAICKKLSPSSSN